MGSPGYLRGRFEPEADWLLRAGEAGLEVAGLGEQASRSTSMMHAMMVPVVCFDISDTCATTAATWLRERTMFVLSREARRTAAVQRLMNDLEHVLTTRGYAVEETETEALCRALIDRAFPELSCAP